MKLELKMELCLVILFAKNTWNNVLGYTQNTTSKVKNELENRLQVH